MSYQLPTLEELIKLADALEANYSGSNPQRLNLIKFFKKLVAQPSLLEHPNAARIIAGAYTLGMESIENSYRVLPQTRSRLFLEINSGLHNTDDNQMLAEDKYACLEAFSQYVHNDAQPSLTADTMWASKQELEVLVTANMKALLAKQAKKEEVNHDLPTLADLIKLASTLEANYTGSNPQRLNLIKFFKKIVAEPTVLENPEAVEIIAGAYIFGMEHIENSYRVLSQTRSRLFVGMEKGLNITDAKPMHHENKYICLQAFYQYLHTQAPRSLTADTTWVEKEALEALVVKDMKALLAKQYKKVDCVLSRLPTFQSLCQNFQNCSDFYDNNSKDGYFFSGKSHAHLARFIDFMSDYCNRFHPVMSANHLDPALEGQSAYILRIAAIVYVMRCIEDKFRAGNSVLHNYCGKGIKGKEGIYSPNIHIEDRISWLAALSLQIRLIQINHKDFLKEKAREKGYANIHKELEAVFENINRYLTACYAERDNPGVVQNNMTLAASSVAQAGMVAFIRNGVGDVLPNPVGALMDTAAGAAGFAVLGPGGVVLGSTISRMVRSNIITSAAAVVVSSVLEKAAATVGAGVTGVVILPFTATAKGIRALAKMCGGPLFDPTALLKNEKFVKALMRTPDDIFAPDKKAVIETTYGIRRMTLK